MGARAVFVAYVGLCVAALAGAGCSSAAPLSVDLRTDFVPAREFVRVECTLVPAGEDAGASAARHTAHNISASGDYLAGVRVAEIGSLAPGAYTLRVELLDLHAGVVSARRVDVSVGGHTSVTVLMTRNCQGIVCPRGGDPDLTECVDGACVDPRCTPTSPSECPVPRCTSDGECTATGCGRASCAGGTCLVAPNDVTCGAGMICGADLDCVVAPTDGGLGTDDAGTGGTDAGTGGGTDAWVDPTCPCTSEPCVTRTCNGTSTCTITNAGIGTGCPDDGNPCTADLCDGNGTCTHPPAADGTGCGTGEYHCCRGACVDVTSDATNCGACGVRCVAGHPCMRIPTTNFGTCGCTAPYDSACAGYGPGAWCSPGGRCQCTCGCPTTGPCDMRCSAACGTTGATCRDINGMDNWCYY